jgi:hypothetical protein
MDADSPFKWASAAGGIVDMGRTRFELLDGCGRDHDGGILSLWVHWWDGVKRIRFEVSSFGYG